MSLTKDQILKAADLQPVKVPVPEWGGDVFVRALNAGERDRFEASLFAGAGGSRKQDLTNLRAKLVVLCCVDDSGKRLFADTDVDAVSAKAGAAVDRVFVAAQKLNGMTSVEVEAAAKN